MSAFDLCIKDLETQLENLTGALLGHTFTKVEDFRFLQGQYRGIYTALEQFKDVKRRVEGGYDE